MQGVIERITGLTHMRWITYLPSMHWPQDLRNSLKRYSAHLPQAILRITSFLCSGCSASSSLSLLCAVYLELSRANRQLRDYIFEAALSLLTLQRYTHFLNPAGFTFSACTHKKQNNPTHTEFIPVYLPV